jgi:GNAT superfamily N-acetyltransferase
MKLVMIRKIQIIRADPSHSSFFPECLALVDRTQGRGIFALDYFERCASDGEKLLLLALLDGSLVGVAGARVLPQDGFDYYLSFGREVVVDLFQHHRVGLMSTASVVEPLQGQGIGQELTRRRIQWMNDAGCTAQIAVSWESGLAHTSDRVFMKLGFKCLSQVKGFYGEDSTQRGWICPVCGSPPCRCSASFYIRYAKS